MSLVGADDEIRSELPQEAKALLHEILQNSESSKGVITVVITSLVYKIFHPEQDIRNHQSGIPNGYSGRTFDFTFITPFLKSVRFPAMAESGWLTRSLEQKVPYDMNYTGAIRPDTLKEAFLGVIDHIERTSDWEAMLSFLFQGLILQRNKQRIELAKPVNLPIGSIIDLLNRHFFSNYNSVGASRLPVLALYAAYQCLIDEVKRFEGKTLAPIESHTSADKRSGRIGDIEISNPDGKPFEAVEVKHGIPLTAQLVKDAYDKFSKTQVLRYYLLSTNDITEKHELEKITTEVERIKNIHGCQVIVNGLTKTLNYYLRLLSDPAKFIDCYVDSLEEDNALKFEHKQRWNELLAPS